MSHAHFHRHKRQGILPEVASFLGIDIPNADGPAPPATVTEAATVVYVTASPTFTGPIGGYVTGTDPTADPTPTTGKGAPVGQPTKTTTTSKPETSSTTTKAPETTTLPTSTQSTHSTQSTQSTSSDLLTTSSDPSTTFVTSSSTQSTSSTSTAIDQFSSSTASATPSAATSTSNGLTGGAKAGIAIGVLGGIGLIAGLVLLWLHKQRKNREEAAAAAVAAENEKFAQSQPPPMTNAPPQQSMGAYSSTQSGGANPYAAGAAVGAAAAGLQVNRSAERAYSGSAHVPPQSPRHDPFTDPVNPFDNGAQAPSPPMPSAKGALSPVRDLTTSTGSAHNLPGPIGEEGPLAGSVGAAVAGAAVGGAAVAAVATTKFNDNPAEPRTPSPEYVENAGSRPQSPVVGGAGAPVSNVHRVQMDFTPSLADEMELRAGQLVRLLKSYDDGWVKISSSSK